MLNYKPISTKIKTNKQKCSYFAAFLLEFWNSKLHKDSNTAKAVCTDTF